ncbi:MAG TPA: hypothetical protein VG938_01210 [Verrucomicrobiae bacterium]|jgi:hypothetical protein|nr:hypothetical protein [Verrucomicrobiae bacterium]
MDTLESILKILQPILAIFSGVLGLFKMKAATKKFALWIAVVAAIIGTILVWRGSIEREDLEHPWYLKIHQTEVVRTSVNPPGDQLAYRVIAYANGQEYSFPYGALVIQENIVTTLPDKFPLPGPPPYRIKFEAQLIDITKDQMQQPRILEGPENTVQKGMLPLLARTNEASDTTITGHLGKTKLIIEYSIEK